MYSFAKSKHNIECFRYTDDRSMFAVHVITGDVARGDSSMVRPPPRDPTKQYENFYDTCVDNERDPSIYVVFEAQQAYPAYIIRYWAPERHHLSLKVSMSYWTSTIGYINHGLYYVNC